MTIKPLVAAFISIWAEFETGTKAGYSGVKNGQKLELSKKTLDHLMLDKHQQAQAQNLLSEFTVIKFRDHKDTAYFGAIVVNQHDKEMVLVHRPTSFDISLTTINLFKHSGVQQDIEGILLGKATKYETQGQLMTEDLYNQIFEHYKNYDFTITGHSLGAWMAAMSQFHLQHICKFPGSKAIIFDGPGSGPEMIRISGHKTFHPETMQIDEYISLPNVVNATLWHPGRLLALMPKLPDLTKSITELFSKTEALADIAHSTLHGHDFRSFIHCFDFITGMARCGEAITWPSVTYNGAIAKATERADTTIGAIANLAGELFVGNIDYSQLMAFYELYDSGNTEIQHLSTEQYRIQSLETMNRAHCRVVKIDDSGILRLDKDHPLPPVLRFLNDSWRMGTSTELNSMFDLKDDFIHNQYVITPIGNHNIEEILNSAMRCMTANSNPKLADFILDTKYHETLVGATQQARFELSQESSHDYSQMHVTGQDAEQHHNCLMM